LLRASQPPPGLRPHVWLPASPLAAAARLMGLGLLGYGQVGCANGGLEGGEGVGRAQCGRTRARARPHVPMSPALRARGRVVIPTAIPPLPSNRPQALNAGAYAALGVAGEAGREGGRPPLLSSHDASHGVCILGQGQKQEQQRRQEGQRRPVKDVRAAMHVRLPNHPTLVASAGSQMSRAQNEAHLRTPNGRA
jgi:hypothetical protein